MRGQVYELQARNAQLEEAIRAEVCEEMMKQMEEMERAFQVSPSPRPETLNCKPFGDETDVGMEGPHHPELSHKPSALNKIKPQASSPQP